LDKRLSIPKFTDEEGYSPRMVRNMMKRNSINNNSQMSLNNSRAGSNSISPTRRNIQAK
jgi:hypothetical protein